MANMNKMTANEQLFIELTPEEGANVSGGATFTLHSVRAVTANADSYMTTGNEDDLYINFDGQTIYSNHFRTNEFHRVEKSVHFDNESRLELWDNDYYIGSDDYMGGKQIFDTPVDKGSLIRSGSGSMYVLKYSVTV